MEQVMRLGRLLRDEEAGERLGLKGPTVRKMRAAGLLPSVRPNGRAVRIPEAAVDDLIRRKVELATLPDATQRVGSWTLPSGRGVEIFIGPAENGARRLKVYYDDVRPLDAADNAALENTVLPEAAQRIQQMTGRRGWAFVPTPGQAAAG